MNVQHRLIGLILMCCINSLSAQDKVDPDKIFKIYKTWISLRSDSKQLKGVLYEIKDSSVLFSYTTSKADYLSGNFAVLEIYHSDIRRIAIRRKGSVGKGAGIGAAVGFLIGGVIGLASGDDTCPQGQICFFVSTAEDKAVATGVTLGFIGAAIGAIAGSTRKKFHINGDFNNYYRIKNMLEKYSVKGLSQSY